MNSKNFKLRFLEWGIKVIVNGIISEYPRINNYAQMCKMFSVIYANFLQTDVNT